MAPAQPNSGLFVGLNRGHVVTKRELAPRPSSRKGATLGKLMEDLAADVTDYVLQETFRSHYPSVKGAKVVTDRITGRSRGYGFVRFGDANEQTRAMTEMNGSTITGPIGKECADLWSRIASAANAIV